MKYVVLQVFLAFYIRVVFCNIHDDIVEEARSHIGETKWSYTSSYGTGRNTNKCNQFVYDVLKEAGVDPPRRRFYFWWGYYPIGAGELGNEQSSYLSNKRCWNLCRGNRRPGDVIGDGRHVGIVTGYQLTTSASTNPPMVVENDWGFRSTGSGTRDSITACWRYVC